MADKVARGARVTGPQRDTMAADIRDRYQEGKSIRDIAGATGRSYGFVHRILNEAGVTLRGRGGATRSKKS